MVKGEIGELDKYHNREETVFIEYDRITLLPSVDEFKKVVKNNIKNSIINETKAALILFDIDNFKHVNDSFGHEFGDVMLKCLSGEIRSVLDDDILMCRYSGDTFILYLNNIDYEDGIITTVEKVFDIFKKAHEDIYLTISMGIALVPKNGIQYDFLLKNADIAMYEAKMNGKNKFKFFSDEMGKKVIKEYTLQKELRTSLEKNEIYVMFQPKVLLEDYTVCGFEALARWNNEKFGEVSPVKFIPLAEESKMIVPIGTFVLEEVCKKIRYLSTRHLEVEITESMFMKSFESNLKVLEEIKKMGITIALDDFGTGYSSLSYLTKLPIDVLKIDRSFIIDLCLNPKEKCMVENIVRLSHQLGIEVVAEGVEEEEQAEYLKAISCDFVQGYYFSNPKSFDEIIIGKKL